MRLTEQSPDTAWTLSLADMTLRGGELCLPVRMPEEAREALMQGRWDAVVELMNAPEAVEALAARMPNPQPH